MIKRYFIRIGIFLSVAMLVMVHIYSPVARSLSSHSPSHSHHVSDSSCQLVCQATVDKRKNHPSELKDQDDMPISKPLYFNAVAVEMMGVGLLQDGTLWRQSSWLPPDITLLSGHYSSGL